MEMIRLPQQSVLLEHELDRHEDDTQWLDSTDFMRRTTRSADLMNLHSIDKWMLKL